MRCLLCVDLLLTLCLDAALLWRYFSEALSKLLNQGKLFQSDFDIIQQAWKELKCKPFDDKDRLDCLVQTLSRRFPPVEVNRIIAMVSAIQESCVSTEIELLSATVG